MKLQRFESIIDKVILFFLMLLVMGTPLLFTSYTRSVFEVNKLLLLRVCTILIIGVWLFYYLVKKDNKQEAEAGEYWSIFGFKWKKIGLEIPTIAWMGLNILSTIFAQNHVIAIIGAYDRWEGIITILNYSILWFLFAKWVRKPYQLTWLLFGILISTTISSIYGICQSLGLDYMNWSVNASARVFACINNPVHFCAYVAMVGAIMLGWLLTLAERPNNTSKSATALKWCIFVCTLVIFYAQFISFSRAAWLGFCLAITLFYLISLRIMELRSRKELLIDSAVTTVAIASLYLLDIFKVYINSKPLMLILIAILVIYLAILSLKQRLNQKENLLFGGATILLAVGYLIDFPRLPFHAETILQIVSALGFLALSRNLDKDSALNSIFARIAIIVLFTKLQFVSASFSSAFILHPLLVVSLYYLTSNRKSFETFKPETRYWLLATALCYGLVIAAPAIPEHIHTLLKGSNDGTEETNKAVENAQLKATAYQVSFAGHSARYSMWKSAIPWVRDYWILGSGPDSVKYMYPDYRRPDYGILEGGHNFTPDKLHNEYINTLATRGVPASIVYYGWLIVAWLGLVLTGYRRIQNQPHRFILLGLFSAATVYLGQILFNFGVVATLVLFYIFVGMAHAIVTQPGLEEPDGH